MKTKLSGRVHQALVCRAGRYSANHHIIISINECECYAILENLKSIYIYQQIKEVLASECLTTLTGWQEGDLATNDSHKSYSKSAYLQAECPSSCISKQCQSSKGNCLQSRKIFLSSSMDSCVKGHHTAPFVWCHKPDNGHFTADVCVCVCYRKSTALYRVAQEHQAVFFLFLPFFIASRAPAYFWTSELRPCNGPVCAGPGRGEELVGVSDVCMMYRKAGLSRSEQLVRYLCWTPLDVAYCLA